MEVTIRPSRRVAQDVWETELQAGDLSLFGKALHESGSISVLQLSSPPNPGGDEAELRFDHRQARVLNLGHGGRTIVIAESGSASAAGSPGVGDRRFLDDLLGADPELHRIGDELLRRVRASHPGDLRYREQSRKYIETPDNCWAVKIQPRDHSLAMTVRGTNESLGALTNGLDVRPDRPGYSRFKISSVSQVTPAAEIIARASRKGT
jgi:hypothetical protein